MPEADAAAHARMHQGIQARTFLMSIVKPWVLASTTSSTGLRPYSCLVAAARSLLRCLSSLVPSLPHLAASSAIVMIVLPVGSSSSSSSSVAQSVSACQTANSMKSKRWSAAA
eukprot:3641-Heterococcus_DN1.PRE.1